jgi:WD40 repeat protein
MGVLPAQGRNYMFSRRGMAALLVGAAVGWGLYLFPLERPRALLHAPQELRGTTSLTFSADSRYLVTTQPHGSDKNAFIGGFWNSYTARLWDVAEGALAAVLTQGDEYVASVAFSEDGRRVACRQRQGRIRVWECASGQTLEEWNAQPPTPAGDPVQITFGPEDRLLAQDAKERTKFRDVRTNDVAFDCAPLVAGASRVITNKPGCILAHLEGQIVVVRTDRGEEAARFAVAPFMIHDITPDRQTVLIRHRGLCIWHADRGLIGAFKSDSTSGFHFISPDGDYLVHFDMLEERKWHGFGKKTGAFVQHAEILEASGRQLFSVARAECGAFSPDGKTLALALNTGAVQLWDFPIRKPWHWIIGGGLAAAGIVLALLTWHGRRQLRQRQKSTTNT